MATAAATPAITAEGDAGRDMGSNSSESSGGGFLPPDSQARKAGAVAEAIEAEARRHARHDGGRAWKGESDKEAGEGPTLTGALRHSGVSAMVNMHLSQAERALRTAAAAAATITGSGSDGGRRWPRRAGGGDNNTGSRTKWVWSHTAAKARQGARVPGGWVEEDDDDAAAPLVAAPAKEDAAESGNAPARAAGAAAGAAAPAPAAEDATEAAQGTTEAAERRRAEKSADDLAAAAAAAAATEPVPVGGAECRRAVAALIDTLDAGSAGAAADLSIAQWKVVSLVLLTAAGLGAGAVGQGTGDTAGGAGGDASAHGEAGTVGGDEAAGGAEACVRLCGPEMSLSTSEFRILVEVMLDG